MLEFIEKKDLEEWGKNLKREIYEEVEKALLTASIINAPAIPAEDLDVPRINIEDAIPEGSTTEEMDKIEDKDKVNTTDGRGWVREETLEKYGDDAV